MLAVFLSPNSRLHFATAWAAWVCVLTTTWAFKTGDIPIELVKSTNSTAAKEANEIIAQNMAADMGQMKLIPDPALRTSVGPGGIFYIFPSWVVQDHTQEYVFRGS